MSATTKQRHTAAHRCPVCGGADADPRQNGQRCHGFTDGVWVYCSRPEYAGDLEVTGAGDLYKHWLGGPCRCGVAHAGSTANGAGTATGQRSRIVATYDYRNEHGQLLYQVVRMEPKMFFQRRPATEQDILEGHPKLRQERDGSRWVNEVPETRCVLYRLAELAAASRDMPVWVAEGEKDTDNLRAHGLVATCNPMGAEKWREQYNPSLQGRRLIILPHNDDIGRRHAEQVGRSLHGVAAGSKILALPGLLEHGDVSDWLSLAGNTRARLEELAAQAPEWAPAREAPRAAPARPAWPTLAPEALYGLAGEIVAAIDPHTESDQVATLANVLVIFGTVIGRTPRAMVSGSRHGMNENATLVGETSRSRKGTSTGYVRALFAAVEPVWTKERIEGGLSSGEGLINAVRDDSGAVDKDGEPIHDGVEDKRLLVLEEEYARPLKMLEREGNILSTVLRQAWDGSRLSTLVKKSPLHADAAHISVLGHITREELLRYLTETETANGSANRVLWLCVRRSKLLPDGGGIPSWGDIVPRLKKAITVASELTTPLTRDEEARTIWHAVYPGLTEGRPGLLGAVISRSEAHVLRLSCLYALLDQSALVKKEHLLAALALWQYAEASALYIFGDKLGDPIADRILSAVREAGEAGLDRTAIHGLFDGNVKAERYQAALDRLVAARLISEQKELTTGAPRTIYRAASSL
jgi:hypothetical protein